MIINNKQPTLKETRDALARVIEERKRQNDKQEQLLFIQQTTRQLQETVNGITNILSTLPSLVAESISKIQVNNPVSVSPPDVKVSIPKIEVPKAEVEVKVPPVEVKLPIIKVPKPEKPTVNVSVPKIDIPPVVLPENMSVSLKGITNKNALPVVLYDVNGSPFSMSVSGAGRVASIKELPTFKGVVSGRKTVTTAGTAEQFSGAECKKVIITAEGDNTGMIVLGDKNVVAADGSQQGVPLWNNQSLTIEVSNMNLLWIDAQNDGDGVAFTYFV